MTFTPNTNMLKFQNGPKTDAWVWLHEIQPDEPCGDLIEVYPLHAAPDSPVAAINQNPLPYGPINPQVACPLTGRMMRLHIFRDLTCVMLRDGPENGPLLEVFPAAMTIPSQAYDHKLKQTPFMERAQSVPHISLQARQDGLRYTASLRKVSPDEIEELLKAAMVSMAKAIVAGGPVADPRFHDMIPAGARFAPHAKWPSIPKDDLDVMRVKSATRGLIEVWMARNDCPIESINTFRRLPGEPWKQVSLEGMVYCQSRLQSYQRLKPANKLLREFLAVEKNGLKDCYRYGPDGTSIFRLDNIQVPPSSHAAIASMQDLVSVAPEYDVQAALQKHSL